MAISGIYAKNFPPKSKIFPGPKSTRKVPDVHIWQTRYLPPGWHVLMWHQPILDGLVLQPRLRTELVVMTDARLNSDHQALLEARTDADNHRH